MRSPRLSWSRSCVSSSTTLGRKQHRDRACRRLPRPCSQTCAAAPAFQLVMMPSSVLLTIASSEDSTIAASRTCSSAACVLSVMSRKLQTRPTGRSSRNWIFEERSMVRPSTSSQHVRHLVLARHRSLRSATRNAAGSPNSLEVESRMLRCDRVSHGLLGQPPQAPRTAR